MEFKKLIKPPEAYILLPDPICDQPSSVNTGQLSQCFVTLLFSLFAQHPEVGGTKFIPVTWLNLRMDPKKLSFVVAAIVPLVDGRALELRRNLGTAKVFTDKKDCVIETLHCVKKWDNEKLNNLQVIFLVPWPDPPDEIFYEAGANSPSKFGPHKLQSNEEKITLGSRSSYCWECYFQLSKIPSPNIQMVHFGDWFAQSSAELAISLIAAMSRGIFKDCRVLFGNWLNVLVRPELQVMGEVGVLKKSSTTGSLLKKERGLQSHCKSLHTLHIVDQRRRLRLGKRVINSDQIVQGCNHPPVSSARQLRGTTLGLIGITSELPRTIAMMASVGLGMHVIYHQKHPVPCVPYRRFEDMNEMLQLSDIVLLSDDMMHQARQSCCCPQRVSLRKRRPVVWLTQEHFKQCRPHALLVCVTKIQCVDFLQLSVALRTGHLGGAGIAMPTVWSTSLSDLQRLCHLPNVLVLPPVSSSVCTPPDTRLLFAQAIVEHLIELLSKPVTLDGMTSSSTRKMTRIKGVINISSKPVPGNQYNATTQSATPGRSNHKSSKGFEYVLSVFQQWIARIIHT